MNRERNTTHNLHPLHSLLITAVIIIIKIISKFFGKICDENMYCKFYHQKHSPYIKCKNKSFIYLKINVWEVVRWQMIDWKLL